MILNSPLCVWQNKRKTEKFYINMNNYRNTHYFRLNNAKKDYKEQMTEQILKCPSYSHIYLVYILYPATRNTIDFRNITSCTDKFFSDALVELGKLEDDNYNYLSGSFDFFGHVDPQNPRVEIRIIEVPPEVQGDIFASLDFIKNNIGDIQKPDVDLFGNVV